MTPTDPAPPGGPASLAEVPVAVETVLADFFDRMRPVTADIGPAVGAAGEVVADFVLSGGKRVRPTFAWAGWRCAGDRHATDATEPDALRVCASLELLQACALIHDDLIDHSDLRRGRPTTHRVFADLHRVAGWSGNADEHGMASAVLAGDLALAWADDLFAGRTTATGDPPPTPVPAATGRTWAAMRTEVLAGQFLDIVNEVGGDETVDAAYRVIEFKTAAYTVSRPLQLGATLGGAPDSLVTDLGSVGRDLGVAFQLRDDLLGVFGDPDRTGKPSGDDLVAGKRTVLLATGLARAADRGEALAAELRGLVGHPLGDADLSRARTILREVGAVDEMEDRIRVLLASAIDTLDGAAIDPEIRAELAAMGHRIAFREQ